MQKKTKVFDEKILFLASFFLSYRHILPSKNLTLILPEGLEVSTTSALETASIAFEALPPPIDKTGPSNALISFGGGL